MSGKHAICNDICSSTPRIAADYGDYKLCSLQIGKQTFLQKTWHFLQKEGIYNGWNPTTDGDGIG